MPHRRDDGSPLRMVGVCADVTERKRIELALRESELRFGRFMEHLPGLA
jgi:PAS domain-containing protein